MKLALGLFLALAMAGISGTALAQSGVPDLSHCEAWLAYDGPETPTLLVLPGGQGPTFQQARLPDGTVVDATVFLLVRDWGDDPIPLFPYEDMWLEAYDGGLIPCIGGTVADEDTDSEGMTHWVAPLWAGGQSQALTAVMVNGDNAWAEGLALNFNSPDLDGSGSVGLSDVSNFSQVFHGDYDFRADLHRDGQINLSDVGWLAFGMGSQCP